MLPPTIMYQYPIQPYHVIKPNLPSISNRDHIFVDALQPYPSHSTLLVVCANPHVLGTGSLMDPTIFHPMHIPREAPCMRNHDHKCVSERHRLVSSITDELFFVLVKHFTIQLTRQKPM